ncbi:hypothetical protein [Succinimonas amylolytica]|uniref:hypothetical protein n=1 Tax=Succinimonas amylolytica TaxID=83769 RepID=UPI0023A85B86
MAKYLGFLLCFVALLFAYYYCFYDGFKGGCYTYECSSRAHIWPAASKDSDVRHDPYLFIIWTQSYESIVDWILTKIVAILMVLFPVTVFYIGLRLARDD